MTTYETKTNDLHARPGLPGNSMRVLDSKDLFKGDTEIVIRHDDAVYRMKITRQGKLILNK